jgi:hypothetical protein
MRTEHELVTECVNKLLSSRVSSAASYFRNYMTAEENRLWPNIRQFVVDVETMKRLICQ